MKDKILRVIQDLTELPASNPELAGVGYCYAQDILDSFDISLSKLLKLARDNGYLTFVVYPDKDSESSKKYIIAQDTFDIDLLYNDLKNVYDTEPGIVSLTKSKNSKLSFTSLRETINNKISTNKTIIENINNYYVLHSKNAITKRIQEHLGLREEDIIDIENLDLFSSLTHDNELAILIESFKKSDTPLITKIPNSLNYKNLNEAVHKDSKILLEIIEFLRDNKIDIPENILKDLPKHLPKSKYIPTTLSNDLFKDN